MEEEEAAEAEAEAEVEGNTVHRLKLPVLLTATDTPCGSPEHLKHTALIQNTKHPGWYVDLGSWVATGLRGGGRQRGGLLRRRRHWLLN